LEKSTEKKRGVFRTEELSLERGKRLVIERSMPLIRARKPVYVNKNLYRMRKHSSMVYTKDPTLSI